MQGVFVSAASVLHALLAEGVPSPSYWAFLVKMSFVLTLLTDKPMMMKTIPVPKRIQAILIGVNRGW